MSHTSPLLRSLAVAVATLGASFAFTACESTGTGTLEGQFGPIRGRVDVTRSRAPDNEGKKIGKWVDGQGVEYDLYDLDGDGTPDIAKGPDGKWYLILGMTFEPLPSINHPLSGGPTFALGPASSLGQAFDFTGSTTDDLLMQYGWWDAVAGVQTETDSYSDGHLYTGRIVEAYFVVSTQQEFPDASTIHDVEVGVHPLMLGETNFRVYGLGIKGHAVDVTEFAAEMGVTDLDFDYNGLHVDTTIDHATRTAYAYVDGVLFDTYSY